MAESVPRVSSIATTSIKLILQLRPFTPEYRNVMDVRNGGSVVDCGRSANDRLGEARRKAWKLVRLPFRECRCCLEVFRNGLC